MLQVPSPSAAADFNSRRQLALDRINELIAAYDQLARRASRNHYVLQGLTIGLAAITPCLIVLAKKSKTAGAPAET